MAATHLSITVDCQQAVLSLERIRDAIGALSACNEATVTWSMNQRTADYFARRHRDLRMALAARNLPVLRSV